MSVSVPNSPGRDLAASPAIGPMDASERGTRGAARLRRWAGRQGGRSALALAALFLALGVFVVAQWQSRPTGVAAPPDSRGDSAAATIDRLEAEQSDLKRQIANLRADVSAREQQATRDRQGAGSAEAALDQQRRIAGTVALTGPGILVTLDDSRAPVASSDDPTPYIVHDYQLRDVVALLWQGGAVGVSINGERFVNSTSVYCVGSTILINDTRLSPPFAISAVGDPARLTQLLGDPYNLTALKSRVKQYGLRLAVEPRGRVDLPSFDGSIGVRYALPSAGSTNTLR